jgi:hypothetical protein
MLVSKIVLQVLVGNSVQSSSVNSTRIKGIVLVGTAPLAAGGASDQLGGGGIPARYHFTLHLHLTFTFTRRRRHPLHLRRARERVMSEHPL